MHPLRDHRQPALTTQDYVIRFWPRALSFYQQDFLWTNFDENLLVGPRTMNWQYRAVVAINDDTLYASAFLNLRHQPVVLTVPTPGTTFSVLLLDVFGTRLDTSKISTKTGGRYVFIWKDWHGTPPAGTPILVDDPVTILNIRADKYVDGENRIEAADTFRKTLRLDERFTDLADVGTFDFSAKVTADDLAQDDPLLLLLAMRKAVRDDTTQPALDKGDRALAEEFDAVFDAAVEAAAHGDHGPMLTVTRAVGVAWESIQAHWRDLAGRTGWTHPTDFADWGTDYLGRASGNEFIQYGNDASAAGYWHAFVDQDGAALRGLGGHHYEITFEPIMVPEAERFWSLTAYTPRDIELIRTDYDKYVVASYTQNLEFHGDGSLTVYIGREQPSNAPDANWLPVGEQHFNIMLRVYGPKGNTLPQAKYVPPVIKRVHG